MSANGEARGFQGKVAVVTGGTQGLGEGVARLFAARGAEGLVICGRNAARGEAIAKQLSEAGTKTIFVQADLEKVADGRAVIDQAEATFGRLDSLVNCAAATDRGSIENTTEEVWDKLFNLNVKIQFFMSQRAIEVMRRHEIEGTIVNIGTIVAHGGPPFLIPYSSSKGALMTMTRAVANARQARSHPDQYPQHRMDQHPARAHRADRSPLPARELAGDREQGATLRSTDRGG